MLLDAFDMARSLFLRHDCICAQGRGKRDVAGVSAGAAHGNAPAPQRWRTRIRATRACLQNPVLITKSSIPAPKMKLAPSVCASRGVKKGAISLRAVAPESWVA